MAVQQTTFFIYVPGIAKMNTAGRAAARQVGYTRTYAPGQQHIISRKVNNKLALCLAEYPVKSAAVPHVDRVVPHLNMRMLPLKLFNQLAAVVCAGVIGNPKFYTGIILLQYRLHGLFQKTGVVITQTNNRYQGLVHASAF
jgi:hypothetical protein